MENIAWHNVLNNEKLLFKYEFHQSSYHVMATDLTFVYEEKLQEESIIDRFCLLNPHIETKREKIIDYVKQCIEQCTCPENSHNISISTVSTENYLTLKIQLTVAYAKMDWELDMISMQPSMLFTHVIKPMMCIVHSKVEHCQKLTVVIQEKNREIEELRMICAKPHKGSENKLLNEPLDDNMLQQENIFYKLYGMFKSEESDSSLSIESKPMPEHVKKAEKQVRPLEESTRTSDCNDGAQSSLIIKKVKTETTVEQSSSDRQNSEEIVERKPRVQKQLDVKIKKKRVFKI